MAFWQAAHSLHHWPTSAANTLHTKGDDISLLEALMPGCARECRVLNTVSRQVKGTTRSGGCLRRHSIVTAGQQGRTEGVDWSRSAVEGYCCRISELMPWTSDLCCCQGRQWMLCEGEEWPRRCYLLPGRWPATRRAPLRQPLWLAQEQGPPVGALIVSRPQY